MTKINVFQTTSVLYKEKIIRTGNREQGTRKLGRLKASAGWRAEGLEPLIIKIFKSVCEESIGEDDVDELIQQCEVSLVDIVIQQQPFS